MNEEYTSSSSAPRTKMEKTISAMWVEIFDVKSVSVDDSFFDLGGDSSMAVQFANRLERSLGVAVPLHLMMSFNLREIAAYCEEHQPKGVFSRVARTLNRAALSLSGNKR